MMGASHATSGLVAGLGAGILLHYSLPADAALSGFTAGMALIPDLDACHGSAARSLGLISGAVSHVVRAVSGGHRHATHSLMGIGVFTGLAWLSGHYRHDWAGMAGLALLLVIAVSSSLEALRVTDGHTADVIAIGVAVGVIWYGYGLALVPLATGLGCLTHCLGDSLTDSGVMWLYPLSKHRFHFLPEPAAFTTGTWPETRIVVPVLLGSLVLMASWAVMPAADMAAFHAAMHAL